MRGRDPGAGRSGEGADTLKRCVVLLRHPIGSALGCFCVAQTDPGVAGAMQQQPPYKPNGAMPQHDGAARRWLLHRWECVPSLNSDSWIRACSIEI